MFTSKMIASLCASVLAVSAALLWMPMAAQSSVCPSPSRTPAPTPVVPAIPAGYGTVFKKDFKDGVLAPFRALTYPNDHPADLMVQYGVFDPAMVSVHNGYVDLKAVRQADGRWKMAMIGTGMDGRGGASTFSFTYGTARVMAQMNSGTGAWPATWYLNTVTQWGSAEIDWGEEISGQVGGYLHGTAVDGRVVSVPLPGPGEWHQYGIKKTPTYIAFLYDNVEIGRKVVSMTAPLALLADAKVGLTAPSASTPTISLRIAWWTVDP